MSGAVEELTEKTFEKFSQGKGVHVVDCWAAWCGPCRMLSPVVEQLGEELKGKTSFGKLDIEVPAHREIVMQHGIASIPTLLVFKDGQLVDRLVGFRPKDALKAQLSKY